MLIASTTIYVQTVGLREAPVLVPPLPQECKWSQRAETVSLFAYYGLLSP